jgi:hypothetical protein
MLYNMEQDPSQYTNLASDPEYASIKRQLHQRLMKRIEAARNFRRTRAEAVNDSQE